MKQSHALAFLRQLCCLELDRDIVAREFLSAVQTVIPSGNNGFTHISGQFQPAEIIMENMSAEFLELALVLVPTYFTAEFTARMGAWFQHNPVLADPTLADKKFYRSDLYNLLWRLGDMHHCLQAPVMQNGKPLGMLSLHRPRSQRSFNGREQTLCVRLLPYLGHALSTRGNDNIDYGENGPSGMMVLDSQGTVEYACRTARRLMMLAGQPKVLLNDRHTESPLPAKLKGLCRNLQAIFQGRDAAPPSLCHINGQGRFLFRAYWLDSSNRADGGLVGMSVEHQEPLSLKIWRGMKDSPLSPMQREVALLLAQGFSPTQIAQRSNIKATTVKDHIGKIYLKLDIHQRDELLSKLLSAEPKNGVALSR